MKRALILALALAASGCSNDETLAASGPTDAGGGDATADAPPVDPGPPIRSVEHRNPFGRTELVDNLLVDGDFELTAGNGQFGWRAIEGQGLGSLLRETGGLCRSGVSCGVLPGQSELLALAAAPRQQNIEVTLWVKPPAPDCSLTVVTLLACTGIFPVNIGAVPPETDVPDASGWCRHHGINPPTSLHPCLMVTSFADAEQRTLVDDGSLLPAVPSEPSSVAAGPASPELHARAERALRALHSEVPLGRAGASRP